MWKSAKFMVAAVLIAITLVVGVTGAALAQSHDEGRGEPGALMAQVAEILDVDQQELEDAVNQARSELREEAIHTSHQELVDEGTLTEEQVDELNAWMDDRPDVPRVRARNIDRLLDDGILSQEQADEYRAWLKARPDIPKPEPGEGPDWAAKGQGRQDRQDALVTQVADILDIDAEELQDAFKEAKSALHEEALDTRLQQLVDEGTLTEDQADEYKAWLEARPDVPRIWPAKPRR